MIKKNINNKKLFYLNTIIIVLILILIALFASSYIKKHFIWGFNITHSLPDYTYFISKNFDINKLKKEDIIAFYFKKKNDRYYKYNMSFIKRIACNSGDKLVVNDKGVFCNGDFLVSVRHNDSKGRKVNIFYFNGIIPKNKLFVLGDSYNSYDSRYWGFVDKKNIYGVAKW